MSKTVLITGGCGFIGSNIAVKFKEKYPDYSVLSFDHRKRSGSEYYLQALVEAGITLKNGDVQVKADFEGLPCADVVIHVAARSAVFDINYDKECGVATNDTSIANLLEYAKKNNSDFIFLSSGRVYPADRLDSIRYEEWSDRFVIAAEQKLPGVSENGITPEFPTTGYRTAYGAALFGAELLIDEFRTRSGSRTVINRCGAVEGPGQSCWSGQGIMTQWMDAHVRKKELSYVGYKGEGKQLRDILHIEDLFKLIDIQVHNMNQVDGKRFNVGGGRRFNTSLKELTYLCSIITGNKINIHSIKESRVDDIRIFMSDNSYVTQHTGWSPDIPIQETANSIFEWLTKNERHLLSLAS